MTNQNAATEVEQTISAATQPNIISLAALQQQLAAPSMQIPQPVVQTQLKRVKIDENQPSFVVPFSQSFEQISLHFIQDISSYVTCNGANCVACAAGIKTEKRYLLPVFSPFSNEVEVLAISEKTTPGSLLPQILTVLGDVKNSDTMLVLRKDGRYKFVVATQAFSPPENAVQVIKQFLLDYESQAVTLSSAFQNFSNDEILQRSPHVKISMTFLQSSDILATAAN